MTMRELLVAAAIPLALALASAGVANAQGPGAGFATAADKNPNVDPQTEPDEEGRPYATFSPGTRGDADTGIEGTIAQEEDGSFDVDITDHPSPQFGEDSEGPEARGRGR